MIKMKKYYVYKITFEEVPHFYFGMRKHSDPLQDFLYLGTPYTHKSYWEIYTPKKQVMAIFSSQSSAAQLEKAVISQNWKSKYCLNENVGGVISITQCKLGAIKANKTKRIRKELDPSYSSVLKRGAINASKTIKEKRSSDAEYEQKYKKNCLKGLKKAWIAAQSKESRLKRKTTQAMNLHQRGEKNSQFGKMWITKGTKETSYRIGKNEQLPPGYRKGRVIK